jgi:hypothetical protein
MSLERILVPCNINLKGQVMNPFNILSHSRILLLHFYECNHLMSQTVKAFQHL